MGPRPAHLTLNQEDVNRSPPQPPRPFFQYGDLPSPRTGEVPPALSPLDAIAMHSRMLAKRFQDSEQKGRRISRIQHADVEKELANRPGYFRSVSDESEAMSSVPEESSPTSPKRGGLTVQGEDDKNRPVSHYPMMGHFGRHSRPGTALSTAREEAEEHAGTPYQEFYDAQEGKQAKEPDYFGIAAPRASSPEPVDPRMINIQAASPGGMPSLTSSMDSVQSAQTQPRTLTNGSTRSQRSLAPPKSPAFPKSPRSMHSIRSVPPDSDTEDASVSGYAMSSSRKFSGSSNMSRPQSPFSPFAQPVQRSPSMTSEYSMNGSQRRTNFSRPLSSGGSRPSRDARPSFDSRSSIETGRSVDLAYRNVPGAGAGAAGSVHLSSGAPSRQASGDSVATPFVTPLPAGPISGGSAGDVGLDYFNVKGGNAQTPKEVPKHDLPRGRAVDRDSRGKRDSWIQKQFAWDDPPAVQHELAIPEEAGSRPSTSTASSGPASKTAFAHPEPPLSPAFSNTSERSQAPFQKPFAEAERSSTPSSPGKLKRPESPFRKPWVDRPPSAGSDRSSRIGRGRGFSPAANDRSNSAGSQTFQKSEALHKSSPSIKTHNTDSTDKTVKASDNTPLHQRSGSAELTPDEHLDIGISAHSAGQLSKSTYHLRLAAHAGLPTAMLLYALACRHGWGMRPDQASGVSWLRKAIDGSGLEVADIETTLTATVTNNKNLDPRSEGQEKKKRKAQFALAVYELGISYMNGWGCAKDKPLAVQCYEVAGNWGDVDALAEAGFCYTQGLGVRKNLRKAAGLYRRAAEGGMSMAGNSWIYKPKYMDDDASTKSGEKDLKKKPRSETVTPATIAGDPSKDTREVKSRSRARSIWGRKKSAAA